MRKSLITLSILLSAISLRAQTKTPETNLLKPTYRKVVVILVEDFQTIYGAVYESRTALMNDPKLSPEQKVRQFQVIDAYLKDLPGRIKLDSVKVEGK